MEHVYVWFAIGLVGQSFFFSRFLVQWLASEKARKSVIPMSFWYLSLAGGLLLLVYAVHLHDPVFIIGQSTGAIIYLRNLYLRMQEQAQPA